MLIHLLSISSLRTLKFSFPMRTGNYTLYLCPTNYLETFTYEGRRYYLTDTKVYVSDYGTYGMLPPAGRGFYTLISKKEYKEIKELYLEEKSSWFKAFNCGYVKEARRVQNSLF